MSLPPENPTSQIRQPNRRPCPYCGTLLRRAAEQCTRCRLPQDETTRKRVQGLTGQWFLYDSNNPSGPGVGWAKFRRLVGQGKVLKTSVVRGPATGGLWRFAYQTPGIAGRLGICHNCGTEVTRSDSSCGTCGTDLEMDIAHEPASLSVSASEPEAVKQDMEMLTAVLAPEADLDILAIGTPRPSRPRSGGAGVLMGFLLLGLITACSVVAALYFWAQTHHDKTTWGFGAESEQVSHDGQGGPLTQPTTGTRPVPLGQPSRPTPTTGAATPVGHPDPPALPPVPVPTSAELAQAQERYENALADEKEGMFEAAQQNLRDLLDNLPRSHWPAGAEAALKRMQGKIKKPAKSSGFFGLPEPS